MQCVYFKSALVLWDSSVSSLVEFIVMPLELIIILKLMEPVNVILVILKLIADWRKNIGPRVVSKPGFLWNQMNHDKHKIFWLFRSKALQKVKKIKNPCRFRVSNLPSKFLKKSLSKMTIFISKMKWHFRI